MPDITNTTSAAEKLQKALPDAKVVKTLNTTNCKVMVDPSRAGSGPTDIFVASDHDDAKDDAVALLKSFGWINSIDLGGLDTARATEGMMPMRLRLMDRLGTTDFNYRIVTQATPGGWAAQHSPPQLTMKGTPMSEQTRPQFAALVADAFQDSEFFLPKIEIEKMGFDIEVISIADRPVDMWCFFHSIGHLAVDKCIDAVSADDFAGVLVPGGAHSPTHLSVNQTVKGLRPGAGRAGQAHRRDLPSRPARGRGRCRQG